ncbi:hypothetical protein FOA52_004765 [Chlamydomonas sp. UWO 241]|nr:hypothetical protein FOA52_004765 [Chlamydomonas sp. UWO 241]
MTPAPGARTNPGSTGQGALIGAGLTLGLTLTSRLFMGLVFGRKKRSVKVKGAVKGSANSSLASTPKAAVRPKDRGFGSPTPIDLALAPGENTPPRIGQSQPRTVEVDLAPKATGLPPGQLKQQLQLLKDAQEENTRLRLFMEQHLAASDKFKNLEKENSRLADLALTLKSQLEDIKDRSAISNGSELSRFKEQYAGPAHARSVYSDVDFGKADGTASDGGAASVMGYNPSARRKNASGLNQLFQWANKIAENTGISPAPSQPTTPRGGSRNTSSGGVATSDVVALLNGFGVGAPPGRVHL